MQTDLKENRIPETSLLTKIRERLNSGGIMTLIFLAILAVFAFYVNRNIRIDALYMDDLYMWSFYGEQSIFEFTFPFRTSVRFRPVCWLLTYLQMATVGSGVSGYVTFNIIANILLSWALYGMCNRISKNRIAAFLAGLVFLASRFSYYQIGQALGYMETLACFFSLHVLYFLYRYLTVPNDFTGTDCPPDAPLFARSDQRYFAAAMFFYVLVSFTHERFIPLVPLFYLVLILKLLKEKKENRKDWFKETRFLWIIPAVTVAVIMLIRFIFIGQSIPVGTGGTEVTETFSVSQTLRFCLSQVLYLLGINDGPEYLCAIPWENTPANMKELIKAGIVCYCVLGLAFLISMIRDLASDTHGQSAASKTRSQNPASVTSGQRRFCCKVAASLLFAGFIAICIVCSSITVRLEMRWVYVSFAAMQIFACYMTLAVGSLTRGFHIPARDPSTASVATAAPAAFATTAAAASINSADPAISKPAAASAVPAASAPAASTASAPTASMASAPTASTASSTAASTASAPARPGSPITNPAILAATFVYLVYAVLSLSTNAFCRTYVDNFYFMEGQNRANSIAQQTVGTYGAYDVLGKTVFLVGTSYDISDFYCEYFFHPFDPEKTGQGSRLVLVDTVEEALAYLEQKREEEVASRSGDAALQSEAAASQSGDAALQSEAAAFQEEEGASPGEEGTASLFEEAIFLTEDPVTGRYVPLEF